MKRRIWFIVGFVALIAVLSGCSQINEPITPESKGFWNEYIVYPLSWLIKYVAHVLGGSFGLSIIVVTIFIRLLILPLMIQQTRNAKAMQALQPEIQKLREKYSSKDMQTQQKLQQEMMLLFQKHGVNPMAGCFPILIQMPILIGFYHAIMRTREIAEHNFLWFDLGEKDPYYILPIIAGVTTFIQQKIMMANAGQQNPQMAMMLWMMPIMIVIFAINFPAALSLYWVVGNIFSIVQTYLIKGPTMDATHSGGTKK
ncbi:YidC family membrane integrase SpoIIIJ [Saccharococcus caldoxylosilyticus]|uniref:Membrane protein insertase YidC n=1 Tax=Parageobacillus caldoxylosilyticus NBRC 107762 TaxID=1220594 RepID=A0A023DB62_9BACL|nr:YidC family membrane integrase SpoIIIJ [Parageobacillus caldoxylosilyticus]MBB3851278.1 YidC/Oxa1 family membrane protein insertase [Parageobacillus caldoxylosilyticus]BDG37860.1 membrane protein insertase MisCA [Parageobacillus caldoxylosilyticus]BDG41653.1 membrane protein insertase MisCA [Parageobacillus caldoxylosilyticus]BDG45427.1 membrane protein insertase MisCA [Parageobacillus caldoxylosilyticus]GAJ38559.1 membrane protein insertase YidC [Parageobacillus caldoxylosilyticus NBRC 107